MDKIIIVATGKNAPNGFGVQKYDNDEKWNTKNGTAPNGVNATRWLRKTTPDPTKLTSLAGFLVENCPGCVAGNFPAFNPDHRVRCYNGKTRADMSREAAERGVVNGGAIVTSNIERARQLTENFIRAYDLENDLARIDDWHFDRIKFEESDEEYWNRTAATMIAVGTVRVTIGNAEWRV